MTEMPTGWEEIALGEVCAVAPSDPPIGDIAPFIPMAAVKVGVRYPTSAEQRGSRGGIRARSGDLLFARITPCLENEKVALVPPEMPTVGGSTEFIVVRPPTDVLSSLLYFWSLHPLVRRHARHRMTGTTGRMRLSASDLAEASFWLPPTAEQRRIVTAIEEAFSKLDAGEAGLRTARQLLKRMREAVLAAAVTGRLVPQDPTDTPATKLLADLGVRPLQDETLGVLPAGWAWAVLDSLNDPARPICYGILMPGPDVPDGIPYVKVRDVRGGRVLVDQLHRTSREIEARYARSRIRPGDLLVTIRGTFGRTAIVPDRLVTANVTQDTARVSLLAAEPRYVALFIDSPFGQRRLAAVARGVAVKGVNIRDLRLVPIPVPPAEEQRRIFAEVDRQTSFIESCDRAIDGGLARSAALRRSVLKAAFEGRLVPQDPSDEPASVLLNRIRSERAVSPSLKRQTKQSA